MVFSTDSVSQRHADVCIVVPGSSEYTLKQQLFIQVGYCVEILSAIKIVHVASEHKCRMACGMRGESEDMSQVLLRGELEVDVMLLLLLVVVVVVDHLLLFCPQSQTTVPSRPQRRSARSAPLLSSHCAASKRRPSK